MNRRSFLQALAAIGAAGPVLGRSISLPQTRSVIDYSLFTYSDDHRLDIGTPFILPSIADGRDTLFATDRRILISHPVDCASPNETDRRLPRINMLPWDSFDKLSFRSLSDHPDLSRYNYGCDRECSTCFGRGVIGNVTSTACKNGNVLDDCELCDGEGWVWHGDLTCGDCGGKRYRHEETAECFEGAYFSNAMMARIRSLGNVEVCVDPLYGHQRTIREPYDTCRVLLFRFAGGGKGMLCSLSGEGQS
jgi:hypothetical protein